MLGGDVGVEHAPAVILVVEVLDGGCGGSGDGLLCMWVVIDAS